MVASEDAPNDVSATVVLCDWAEAINGKLYIQGAGWTRILPDAPVPSMGIAVMFRVPYSQTNQKFRATLKLVTDDAAPYPPEEPFIANAEFEVGRPAGMIKGEESVVPMAVMLGGIEFKRGRYRFDVEINDEPVPGGVSFVARRPD